MECCLLEALHPSCLFWRVEGCIFWQAEKEDFFCLCKVVPSAFQIPKHLSDFHSFILAARPRIPPGEEFLIWLCNQDYSIANWGGTAVKIGWCFSCLYHLTCYCYLDVGRDFCFFCVFKPDESSLVHVPGGINLLDYDHLWVPEKITTSWWVTRQLLPHSIFQDPDEQDLTNRYGTEILVFASADGCDTSFHPRRWQGKVDLSTSSKRAGHKIPTGQLSHTDGEVWSSGVSRFPAHRFTHPGIAAAPACRSRPGPASLPGVQHCQSRSWGAAS